MNHVASLFILLSLGTGTAGCNESRASTEGKATVIKAASAASTTAGPTQLQVTKVVFIDKQEACDCTRARVTKGWDALQAALGGKPTPNIERLYVDTQPEQVQPYRAMRPMMAVPALYFLNANGSLVDQLQGEFSAAQIQAVLGMHR